MCGIAGFYSPHARISPSIVRKMTNAIEHRGPDHEGMWCDEYAGIALGFRRLAILDLSPSGHQPMISHDGRYVLTFNGEIYNHDALRLRLDSESYASVWRGSSDTEVLVNAIAQWGLEAALKSANGMFAIALWDREKKTLSFARDRLGEKPLYYGLANGSLLFGSELKALAKHPKWVGTIDRDIVRSYLQFSYVPEPFSIFKGFHKLPPGHWVSIPEDFSDVLPKPKPYWQLSNHVHRTISDSSCSELLDQLESKLLSSVGTRMEADVGLGAFLSGGIDSSLIVALMQAQSNTPTQTFTIGFDVPGYNEAATAKEIARHLGTKHTELYVTADDTLRVVDNLSRIWDEPFADSSQVPTLLLSQLTRKSVTVALTGDGGDEFFCGYNRYGHGLSLYEKLSALPPPLRWCMRAVLSNFPVHTLDKALTQLFRDSAFPAIGDRVQKLSRVIDITDIGAFYTNLVSQHYNNENLVLGGKGPELILDRPDKWPDLKDPREIMMYLDALTYLPGDILAKVDRATMAHSLEARAPFLDPDLVEFAWSLPMSMKLRNRKTKWALREILARYIPRDLFERPKMGFGIPIEHWLSGPLRCWADDLLSYDRIRRQGLLNPQLVQKMWQAQRSGHGRWHHQIWTILMLQSWLDTDLVSL